MATLRIRRPGLAGAVALTLLAAASSSGGPASNAPRTITYYIAAEHVDWSYAPLGRDPTFDQPLMAPWGARLVYPKLRYLQYTDDTFRIRVPAPAWLGILGPTLRASVGDTLHVVFLNRADRPLSVHPHGVKYDRSSEGARYEPQATGRGSVAPGQRTTYRWIVDENAGPTEQEPSSKVWLYHSHVKHDEEMYRGLIGTIVVTDPRRARPDRTPADVDRELTTLFMVWNENGHHPAEQLDEVTQEGNLKHAINGLIFGNLQGLEMRQGERVRWYIVALGSEVDLHTAHWHGETVTAESGTHTDVIELLPASMRVVDMRPDNPGTWLYHCHVSDHMMAGMYTTYTVR